MTHSRAIVTLGDWCRRHRHLSLKDQHAALSRRLRGHYQYFGVNGNVQSLRQVLHTTEQQWLKWLRRRSQRGNRLTWERFIAYLKAHPLPLPDHTTLSRRLKTLSVTGFGRLATGRPIHLLIDSTGLRIHVGHMQKPPRNRAWRKLHLAVDADTGQVVASDLTARRTHDCTQVPALLGQIPDPIASLSADGAYDTKAVYEAAHEQGDGRAARVAHITMTRLGMPDSYRVA